MSEFTREALAHTLRDLIAKHASILELDGLDSVVVDGDVSMIDLADDLRVDFLVIPRSDIQRCEYGWRYTEVGQEKPRTLVGPTREDAMENAAGIRAIQRQKGYEVNAEAVSRPVLPWSVIPENGQT